MPAIVQTGVVSADPPPIVDSFERAQSIFRTLPIDFRANYGKVIDGTVTIDATPGAPFVLDLGGIVKVRYIALLAEGATYWLIGTNGSVDGALPFSDLAIIHAKHPGSEVTAIKLAGTGQISYLIAGDIA